MLNDITTNENPIHSLLYVIFLICVCGLFYVCKCNSLQGSEACWYNNAETLRACIRLYLCFYFSPSLLLSL